VHHRENWPANGTVQFFVQFCKNWKSKKTMRKKNSCGISDFFFISIFAHRLYAHSFFIMFMTDVNPKVALTNILRSRDDDTHDHIDSDTPRSGIATPQPDPSDKRLPGIVSYFGQVGTGSSKSPGSVPLETPALGTESYDPLPVHHSKDTSYVEKTESSKRKYEFGGKTKHKHETPPSPSVREEQEQTSYIPSPERTHDLHSYPTPPLSNSPSMQRLKLNRSNSEVGRASAKKQEKRPGPSTHRKSYSDSLPLSVRRASLVNPLSSIVTHSNVHATHFSMPGESPSSKRPAYSRLNSSFHESASYEKLKKLTDGALRKKSTPATPTRALSSTTARSDNSGGDQGSQGSNGHGSKLRSEAVPTPPTLDTTSTSNTTKGKLTVKIVEARGLRRCRDPYVVAVFQRNELVSKGPLPPVQDEHEDAATSGSMGIPSMGIPMSRSGSESGRAMAIPMKSRQSSSTSFTEARDFKLNGRSSITNAKWDTEAVL